MSILIEVDTNGKVEIDKNEVEFEKLKCKKSQKIRI